MSTPFSTDVVATQPAPTGTRQRATLHIEIDYDGAHLDARDVIPSARIWIGDSLEGRTGITGWRITGTLEPATEEATR
jgi:hypothetical protein